MGFEDDIKRNIVPSVEDRSSDNLETEVSPADLSVTEIAAETETQDAQRVREINRIFDEVSWYSKDGKLQLAAACEDFVRPYQASSDASFPDLMQDQKLMPKTLEALRNIFLFIADFDSNANVAQSHPEIVSSLAGIKNFLALEIACELGNIGREDQKQDNPDLVRTNQNNAFYVVSEALSTDDAEKKKAVEKWLGDNVDTLLEMDPFKSSTDGVSTTIFRDALRNILFQVTEPGSAAGEQFLRIALDLSEKESDGGALFTSETYSLTIQPVLLNRCQPMKNILLQMKQRHIAEMIARKFGLDSSIVEKWEKAKYHIRTNEAGGALSWVESYANNLQAVEELELRSPGSAKKLFKEYGIANFYRYSEGMLFHQLKMSDKDVPYGIVVFPEADWNGAFFQNGDKLAEASLKLRMGGLETRIVEAGSQRELARRLVTLNKKYAPNGNKIAFAIIGGHGGENSVTLGEKGSWQSPPPIPNPGEELSEEYLAELEKWKKTVLNADKGSFSSTDIMNGEGIRRGAQEFFVEGAPVVLVSCSTGAEGGIAEKSSGQLGWDISAPDIPTNLEKIDVTFDADGKPLFTVKYNTVDGANTSRYVAGEKVESK